MSNSTSALELVNADVAYHRAIQVLHDVSLRVGEGQLVALLGANGAGKSTLLKAVSNLLIAEGGNVTRGTITVRGVPIDRRDPMQPVALDVAHVMEGRRLFAHLTVEENLRAGAYSRRDRAHVRQDVEQVYGYFPALRDKRSTQAGYLSGGEQQMVALGRALMARPKLLLLDEPSMGLAPMIAKSIFKIIGELRKSAGLSILLAEQNAAAALAIVDYGYVLANGRVVLQGTADVLRANADIRRFYLGLGDEVQAQAV
jgi:branched-chain amino acid transport system ATP-binding protein